VRSYVNASTFPVANPVTAEYYANRHNPSKIPPVRQKWLENDNSQNVKHSATLMQD